MKILKKLICPAIGYYSLNENAIIEVDNEVRLG